MRGTHARTQSRRSHLCLGACAPRKLVIDTITAPRPRPAHWQRRRRWGSAGCSSSLRPSRAGGDRAGISRHGRVEGAHILAGRRLAPRSPRSTTRHRRESHHHHPILVSGAGEFGACGPRILPLAALPTVGHPLGHIVPVYILVHSVSYVTLLFRYSHPAHRPRTYPSLPSTRRRLS